MNKTIGILLLLIIPCISFAQDLKIGLRSGAGISYFRNHAALRVGYGPSAVAMGAAAGLSAGITSQIEASRAISVAPELQYSLYRANYKAVIKRGEFRETHLVGVYMRSLELPVFLRFSELRFLNPLGVKSAYAEIGPQLGFNLHSRIYKNSYFYEPSMNTAAAGIAAGAGASIGRTLLGIRGYFSFTEYASDVKGAPWSTQISATRFLF